MTVTLELKPETEQGLLEHAQERGMSLYDYLQEILSKQASSDNAVEAERGKLLEIPVLHLGDINPLCRRDIYDNADDER